ncbi:MULTISPECIES: GxxExxY protein [unclassified Wenzhouxiangella]|uniref:GxxExxY protein n=1 Tax=unclassified Wenzhouxiangella TaxID=2613841 RepID=UPI000E32A790|nr:MULTISPECIES: GxxExxY protein [unclassified Wenzhouxiangella]RFF27695.1 GxxExxY protein [Wenzhouxiangella sp. 15181]RFP69786.1 GxxExxY protein [Wenzhouxiangella sp. 15190]
MNRVRSEIEETASGVIDAIVHVHRSLGPGLLESAYQACLYHELAKRGFQLQVEQPIPIEYDGIKIDNGFRADMIVNGHLLIENKAVSSLNEVHQAQVITYLKLAELKLGLLVNWNVRLIKEGIRRIAHGLR